MLPAIEVSGISKIYSRNANAHLSYGFRDLIREATGRRRVDTLRKDEFYAAKDVSFSLQPGDTFALIGRNGSGKTTVLKMLNGLIKPDAGKITIRGKVQALINLGAGFSLQLSGRENVYIAASLVGLSRAETNGIIGQIIDFAELDEFIDSPVGTYSTGMRARLGFASAVHLQPDLLLIDEVLSVGDVAFQNKCFTRMEHLKRDGVTIVLVSHSHASVIKLCERAAWLHKGELRDIGPSRDVVNAYLEFLEREEMQRMGAVPARTLKVSLPLAGNRSAESPIHKKDPSFRFGVSEPRGQEEVLRFATVNDVPKVSAWYVGSASYPISAELNGEAIELNLVERADVRTRFPDAPVIKGLSGTLPRNRLLANNQLRIQLDGEDLFRKTILLDVEPKAQDNKARESVYGALYSGRESVDEISFRMLVDGQEANTVPIHAAVTFEFSFRLKKEVQNLQSTLNFHRKDGFKIAAISSLVDGRLEQIHGGRVRYRVHVSDLNLVPGPYVIVTPIADGQTYLWREIAKEFYVEGGARIFYGVVDFKHTFDVENSPSS